MWDLTFGRFALKLAGMFSSFRYLRACGAACGAVLAVMTLAAEEPSSADAGREPIQRAPAPVYSRDNAFVIFSPASQADYRMPVLQFSDELRRSLVQWLRLPSTPPKAPIVLVIGETPGETRAIGKSIRDVMGRWREQIEIGDPERVDLDDLRTALTRALLRDWLAATERADDGKPQDPPDWFLVGLARAVQRARRQADLDKVLMLWSRGRLPPVATLLAGEPEGAEARDPAVSALLVTWLSEREGGVARMRRLIDHLAAGQAWSAELLLPLLWPDLTREQMDEAWDRWLTARSRSILEPGTTTAGMVRRFHQLLLVYPADHNIPLMQGWRARQPGDLIPHAGSPWMKRLTDAKTAQLRMAALGRDGTLIAVAEAYAEFFTALGEAQPAGVLQTRLHAADRLLSAAEEALAAGKPLREPPSTAPRSPP